MSADGTWNCTIDTPMGAQAVTLVLKTDGAKLSGTLSSSMGSMDFTDGTVEGNNLRWTVSMDQPMAMTIETTATVDGDTINGQSTMGSFGSATISGTRAQG